MAVQIQLRNDTAANWTAANPTLAAGEWGYENDTKKLKLGDGTSNWSTLEYASLGSIANIPGLQDALDAKAPLTQSVNAKTANYTLTADDRGKFITCDGTFTITIPSGVFAAGDRVDFVNIGTGVITFAGSGATVNSVDAAVTIDTQWAGATFFFTSSSAGVLIGKLA